MPYKKIYRPSKRRPAYYALGPRGMSSMRVYTRCRPKAPRISRNRLASFKKYKTFDSYGATLSMVPNAGSRFTSFDITSNIDHGDLVNQRQTNKILLNKFFGKFTFVNTAVTARYVRFWMVSLRGSSAAADTTSWTDLFIQDDFTKTGTTGGVGDQILRLNHDEYKVHLDRTLRIPGSGDGVPNMRDVKIKKFMRHIATYLYNSSDNRSGNLHFGWCVSEETGTAVGAGIVYCDYSFTQYFKDLK